MDSYRQDSAHIASGSRLTIFDASSREEKETHKRWARSVLVFYCALFVLVGIAVLTIHSATDPDNQIAQASLQAQARR